MKKQSFLPTRSLLTGSLTVNITSPGQVKNGETEEKLFLEYLIHGKVDIYYYRDESGEHYFAQKGDDRLVPLTNDEKSHYANGIEYLQESNQYIGMLKYLFQESPEVSRETESVTLDHKSLIKISKKYHNAVCTDEQCIIYEKKIPKADV